MNKIIFLDIDGVLNDIYDMISNINISRKIYNNVYPNRNYEQEKKYISINFSFEKLQILKKIIRITDAKIVLSSSWRSILLMDALIDNGIPVIGMTPYVYQKRGKEIKEYLKNNECDSFCILDDEICDYEEEDLLDYLVKTDGYSYSGLSDEYVNEIVDILSRKVYFMEKNREKLRKLLTKS